MSSSMFPDEDVNGALALLPYLAELGRTGGASVIPESLVPNSRDFHFLWSDCGRVLRGWEIHQIENLIKGLTYLEKLHDLSFGSVPPVAAIFRFYVSRVGINRSDDLANWVLANTGNDYCPFGTSNYGAKSLTELREESLRRSALKRAKFEHQLEMVRSKTSLQATARLPNALRRRDSKAVAALLAKGADIDAEGASGRSAREIAKELDLEAWLSTSQDTDG